jgi:hypothetical protein
MFKVRYFQELRLQKLRVSLRAAIKVSNYFRVSSAPVQRSSVDITAKNSAEKFSLNFHRTIHISASRVEQEFVPARKYPNSLVLSDHFRSSKMVRDL